MKLLMLLRSAVSNLVALLPTDEPVGHGLANVQITQAAAFEDGLLI